MHLAIVHALKLITLVVCRELDVSSIFDEQK